MHYLMLLGCALAFALPSLDVRAIETAPRISDREIIEALAQLNAGQKVLEETMKQQFEVVNQRFESVDQRFESVNQRFESVNQRFESVDQGFESVNQRFESMEKSMNQRFDAMEKSMNQRFEAMEKSMNQRFEAMEKRFDDLHATILTLFSAVILLIVSLFGYIIWDRRTALRPLENRLLELEQDLERDLELRHDQGSLPTRLLKVLRELAREDEKLASALRTFSML